MKLSDLKKLHQKKYRSQFDCYLIEGEHLILELCKAINRATNKSTNKAISQQQQSADTIAKNIVVYTSEDKTNWAKQLPVKLNVVEVSPKQMMDMSDTKSPQGVVARVAFSLSLTDGSDKTANVSQNLKHIYLHEVQDPGNLGTILRTLAWFGGFRLLLSPNSVDPYNPKVIRASMGAIFHMDIEQNVQLEDLQKRFSQFAYLDINGKSVSTNEFAKYDCYLFGNEARGVPHQELQALEASAFTIEGGGKIDSLNLASAVNICAFQLSKTYTINS